MKAKLTPSILRARAIVAIWEYLQVVEDAKLQALFRKIWNYLRKVKYERTDHK
jgi:hypothetical protein